MQLADTSAWVWTRVVGGELRAAFDEDLVDGQIAICDMVRLELLYSARNAAEFTALSSELDALPSSPIGVEQWKRGPLARAARNPPLSSPPCVKLTQASARTSVDVATDSIAARFRALPDSSP